MYKVVVLKSAKSEILNAANYYNSKQQNLGLKFTSELKTVFRFIENYPKASSIKYKSIRTTVLNNFPFMIHYRVNEEHKTVTIEAVYHTSLRPENWK